MIFPSEEEMSQFRNEVLVSAQTLYEKMSKKLSLVNSDYTPFEKHLFEYLSRFLVGNSIYDQCGILIYSISYSQDYVEFFTKYDNIIDKQRLITFLQGVNKLQF